MPIYEYSCSKCGEVGERYEHYVDRQLPPPCCGEPTTKLISAGVFDLHGSGFYQNDHGSGAHKLATTDQARRAAREVKERGYVAARPQAGAPPTREMVGEMKNNYGSKEWKEHLGTRN